MVALDPQKQMAEALNGFNPLASDTRAGGHAHRCRSRCSRYLPTVDSRWPPSGSAAFFDSTTITTILLPSRHPGVILLISGIITGNCRPKLNAGHELQNPSRHGKACVSPALGLGRPVVTLRTPSSVLIVDHRRTGLLSEGLDDFPTQMARLADDRSLCGNLGRPARKNVEESHSIKVRSQQNRGAAPWIRMIQRIPHLVASNIRPDLPKGAREPTGTVGNMAARGL